MQCFNPIKLFMKIFYTYWILMIQFQLPITNNISNRTYKQELKSYHILPQLNIKNFASNLWNFSILNFLTIRRTGDFAILLHASRHNCWRRFNIIRQKYLFIFWFNSTLYSECIQSAISCVRFLWYFILYLTTKYEKSERWFIFIIYLYINIILRVIPV